MTLFSFLPICFNRPKVNYWVAPLLVLFFSSFGWSQQRLILIGGGPGRPTDALKLFSDLAHQENGRILLIAWGSSIPAEVADDLMVDFSTQYKGLYLISNAAPETADQQAQFLNLLKDASGVFFSGGDQNVIMSAFQRPGGDRLRNALLAAYNSGIVFGGTSAGTAIMSKQMISGNIQENGRVPVSQGLGLLPGHIIVDQHFSQRTRKLRLMRAHTESGTDAGIGIDEDTALIIFDNARMRVSGDHTVRVFSGVESNYIEWTLKDGDELPLPPFP